MQELFTIFFNVLIISSMYIMVTLGFAFLFNMLGILNLAQGAIYMIGGYIGYSLIVELQFHQWASLLLSVLLVGGFGIVLERFCFRPFIDDFKRLLMICVAITVIFQTTVNIIVGTKIVAMPSFVDGVFHAGSLHISYDKLVIFTITILLLMSIVWFVKSTTWGHQMQAIAQNRDAASLQGINVRRVSAVACAMGCGLAAMSGCLMSVFSRLGPFMGDFILIKILIVFMLAGVGTFSGIFVGGLILGTLDGILPVFMHGATSDAITICIVILILVVRPRGFFGRRLESTEEPTLPGPSPQTWAPRPRSVFFLCTAVTVILCVLPLVHNSPYFMHILTLTFIYTIASASLRTILISGQFAMAHGAYMGIGAYISAMTSLKLGWSPFFSIPFAAVATGALGVLLSWPFARLREFHYAMASLFFGIGVILIIHAGGQWTGGYSGMAGIRPIFTQGLNYYYFFLATAVLSLLALYRLEMCRIGTHLRAIAQSHIVASSVGINEGGYRMLVVGVGCFFVGLAGANYAHYNMVVSTSSFNLMATLWIIIYVLVGGIESFFGPIIGTFIVFLIPEIFRDLKMYSPFISAGILLVVIYLIPGGLGSLPHTLIARSWIGTLRRMRLTGGKGQHVGKASRKALNSNTEWRRNA